MTAAAWISILLLIAFIGYLAAEAWNLRRWQKAVPIRIGVTGTRGKSSVSRLIYGALSGAGMNVLCKVSGTEARMIYPDGSEHPMPRFGLPSILEEKLVLRTAASLGCDAVVSELMSIRPENLGIESRDILGITHACITNCRIDHPEQGDTPEEVSACYSLSFPAGGDAFCPESEIHEPMIRRAGEVSCRLHPVATYGAVPPQLSSQHPDNVRLVLSFCSFLSLDEDACIAGMAAALPDPGALSVRRIGGVIAVNGFAANDILSSSMIVSRFEGVDRIALISLRDDRPERTAQYIEAVRKGTLGNLCRIYFCGRQAGIAAARSGKSASVKAIPRSVPAEEMTDWIMKDSGMDSFVLIGMGNIKGTGMALVSSWEEKGEPYEL